MTRFRGFLRFLFCGRTVLPDIRYYTVGRWRSDHGFKLFIVVGCPSSHAILPRALVFRQPIYIICTTNVFLISSSIPAENTRDEVFHKQLGTHSAPSSRRRARRFANLIILCTLNDSFITTTRVLRRWNENVLLAVMENHEGFPLRT